MQATELPDMPAAAHLSFATAIHLATPDGIVQMFPFHTMRGTGKSKHTLSIHAFTTSEVVPMQTCYCSFRGTRYPGHFFYVSLKHRGKYTVQFETIIPDEAFWEAAD